MQLPSKRHNAMSRADLKDGTNDEEFTNELLTRLRPVRPAKLLCSSININKNK